MAVELPRGREFCLKVILYTVCTHRAILGTALPAAVVAFLVWYVLESPERHRIVGFAWLRLLRMPQPGLQASMEAWPQCWATSLKCLPESLTH
eukprot:s988_g15.t1